MTLPQRKDFVRSKGLCFGCLLWGHISKICHRKRICKTCKKFHPSSLHNDTYKAIQTKKDENSSEDTKEPPEVRSYRVDVGNDLYKTNCPSHSLIVPVWLHHQENPTKSILVYALLDHQSDACLIKKRVLRQLKVEGPKVQLALSTVLAEALVKSEKNNGLVIRGTKELEEISLPRTYSRHYTSETAQRWSHLQRITNQLTPYNRDAEIGLLIGISRIRAIKPREIIPGGNDEPYAQKTALGWWRIVCVTDPKVYDENYNAYEISCNRVSHACREVLAVPGKKICHFSSPTQARQIFTPPQVQKMFELDFIERDKDEEYLSIHDKSFLDKVKKRIHQPNDGHYEIPLPFKTNAVSLPNNKGLALGRLERLKRRIKNDPQCRKDYLKFMDDLVDNGHAERVPPKELTWSNNKVWYIPHHGVYHPKKPGKIRVVFDCSAEFQGEYS